MKSGSARFTTILPTLVSLTQRFIDPFLTIGVLFYLIDYYSITLSGQYAALLVVIFLLSVLISNSVNLTESWASCDLWTQGSNLLISWAFMIFVLIFLGYITQSTDTFEPSVLYAWALITPLVIFLVHAVIQFLLLMILRADANRRSVVIVGVNKESKSLSDSITSDLRFGLTLKGYFDDRAEERLEEHSHAPLLGKMTDLPEYIKKFGIDLIYITLPVSHQQRVLDLLDSLHDTTASIYFTPDIFVYDLIQSRMDVIDGTPLVALCETPFRGVNGMLKRLADIVFSISILILISPLLVLIAVAVKLSSKGPVLFMQKRYGLDGNEIRVYKFRSMTVCEDGDTVVQAKKGDSRVTALGAILRKYSLDELPQFFNSLGGSMSVVGPRPHAVAHNERYRGMIKGYMIRHKVKPGITGLAQVNGYRGETNTIEKMQHRVEYDLEYLRHWSLGLDIKIIFMTIFAVFQNEDTY